MIVNTIEQLIKLEQAVVGVGVVQVVIRNLFVFIVGVNRYGR